jgi:hypothetical protein
MLFLLVLASSPKMFYLFKTSDFIHAALPTMATQILGSTTALSRSFFGNCPEVGKIIKSKSAVSRKPKVHS